MYLFFSLISRENKNYNYLTYIKHSFILSICQKQHKNILQKNFKRFSFFICNFFLDYNIFETINKSFLTKFYVENHKYS